MGSSMVRRSFDLMDGNWSSINSIVALHQDDYTVVPGIGEEQLKGISRELCITVITLLSTLRSVCEEQFVSYFTNKSGENCNLIAN